MSFTQEQMEMLAQELNQSEVAHRTQGNKELTYIEGYTVIDSLNRIFNHDWSYSVDQLNTTSSGIWYALVTLTLHESGVQRQDVGYGIPAGGSDQAVETAGKAAVTDALKRAARTLGNQFGNSLYDKDSPLHNDVPQPTRQPAQFKTEFTRQAPAGNSNDPGSYVITFGKKHPGRTVAEINRIDANYLDYLVDKADNRTDPAMLAAIKYVRSGGAAVKELVGVAPQTAEADLFPVR